MQKFTGKRTASAAFAKRISIKYKAYPWSPLLKKETIRFCKEMLSFLFPHFSEKEFHSVDDNLSQLEGLNGRLIRIIDLLGKDNPGNSVEIAEKFASRLPRIYNDLWRDARGICQGDPAATGINEVIISYPGFLAIAIYRLAHEFYEMKLPIIPRIMTEYAHGKTGIDINPGATIGSPFIIDHGTGIVIGESCIIGKNVKIYQGVTLGALSVKKSLAQTKRHPTIEDDVIIYSEAVILGGKTVIGKKSIIGGNTWVTHSVPPNSVVYAKNESGIIGKISIGNSNGN